MSQKTTRGFSFATALYQQLRSFGLNPYDWHIENSDESSDLKLGEKSAIGSIQMSHIEDQSFQIRGRLTRNRRGELQIRNLFLASL